MDGTMWDHQTFFRDLMRSMQSMGHQMGVLTGHREDIKERDLILMRMRRFPEPAFFYCKSMDDERTNPVFKAETILAEGIDLHFDDYDFARNGKAQYEQIFGVLGDQMYRVIRVHHREPVEEHFE